MSEETKEPLEETPVTAETAEAEQEKAVTAALKGAGIKYSGVYRIEI